MMLRFGLRVFEERQRAGLTQEDLAEKLGVAVRWMQDIEAGVANVTLTTIGDLSDALGVEAAEFFTAPSTKTVRRPGRPVKT